MILQELRLHNFGLYRGEQVLNLAPSTSKAKRAPITLFGGINGGGKTTILDAVQLALYGQRAQCSKRAGRPYESFLEESIHYGVPNREGAAVALRFLYTSDNGQQEYEIRRTWTVREGKVRESLHVSKNGERDRWLSDNWNQLVEDLIPLGISQLFFFDAEKIRFLAEDETCGAAIGTAVKALLGLDLAERLIADANVLEARLVKTNGPTSTGSELSELEASFTSLEESIRRLKEERASVENEVLLSKKDLDRAEDDFSNLGGKHWKQRDTRTQQLKRLEDRRTELIIQLRSLAEGELPIALVREFLVPIETQVTAERSGNNVEITRAVLEERDAALIEVLQKKRVAERVLETIRGWQSEDLRERVSTTVPTIFKFTETGFREFGHVCAILPERMNTAAEILPELEAVQRKIEDADRSLATASNEGQLKPVLDQLKTVTEVHTLAAERARKIDEQVDALTVQRSTMEQKLAKLRRTMIDSDIENEEGRRIAKLVDQTRQTMRDFLERSTRQKIERLSGHVTESFRFLLRKTTLVQRIEIDPATFRIVLYDHAGQAIPKERLSEGEKQIFAIALLWGLGRASTRPLPIIIDTPMARLDATHRDFLIDRYFPNASHQVIILSTDTEVDRTFYERLSPSVSRAYHLRYDEAERFTTAEEGYFWAATASH